MPTLILALNYWLHLLATVAWLGGMAALVAMAWPSTRGEAASGAAAEGSCSFLEALERRFRPVANVSLAVLLVTGMIQMGGDPHYRGFLRITDAWSASLLAKHLVILGMVGVTAVLQWGIYPALDRARLLARRRSTEGRAIEESLQGRVQHLTLVNLVLGVLVLLITAFLTAQ